MAALDEILSALPAQQVAQQLGVDESQVQDAARLAVPALLGGMQANAQDPSGAQSLAQALGQHDGSLLDGGASLDQIDTQDGQAIAGHIFGGQQDAVAAQLGGLGGGQSALVQKLIPILAPLVIAWLSKQVMGQAGGALGGAAGPMGGQAAGGGLLTQILGQVLSGATQGPAAQQQAPGGHTTGSIITDVLGGLLGGGRR